MRPERVEALLDEGVREGLFPGAVCLWGNLEEPRLAARGNLGRTRDRRPVTADSIYDLASLSKILAAASLTMILEERGLLDIRRPLPQGPLKDALAWPDRWKAVAPAHLLAHQSGLLPWLPLYRLPARAAEEKRRAVLAAIVASKPEAAPGQKTIYSDLNFIMLGFLLEAAAKKTLPRLFQEEIAAPLGLQRCGFCPTAGDVAPTEDGFRLSGPPGHPGPTPLGRVNDDNAAFLGGAAGHAGLFGAAGDVWRIVRDWAAARRGQGLVFGPNIKEYLKPRPAPEGPPRALGFDLKSPDGSVFPPTAAGHLAYTGPSLWWNPENDFACLVLCNRTHPRAKNDGAIADFRRRLTAAA